MLALKWYSSGDSQFHLRGRGRDVPVDRAGDQAQGIHELPKLFREQALRPIGKRAVRVRMHLDNDAVGARRHAEKMIEDLQNSAPMTKPHSAVLKPLSSDFSWKMPTAVSMPSGTTAKQT